MKCDDGDEKDRDESALTLINSVFISHVPRSDLRVCSVPSHIDFPL